MVGDSASSSRTTAATKNRGWMPRFTARVQSSTSHPQTTTERAKVVGGTVRLSERNAAQTALREQSRNRTRWMAPSASVNPKWWSAVRHLSFLDWKNISWASPDHQQMSGSVTCIT